MEKVARILSIEFETAEANKKVSGQFWSQLSRFSPGVELLIAVNTSPTELLPIQVFPSQEVCAKAPAEGDRFIEELGASSMRDTIAYEGDVDFWFQQIKYFGADAINVSGAGA